METPVMLLFVCNGTDQGSIKSDTGQMLETALNNIELNGMVPKEFKNRDIPHLMLKLNAPKVPSESKQTANKAYNHIKEHGKKAFHFTVAKSDISYFKFPASHTHKLKLNTKYLGKFASFTTTLGNNAPISNCTHLRRCNQGHLNYHLSSTCVTINGINTLNALKSFATQSTVNQLAASLFGTFSIGYS